MIVSDLRRCVVRRCCLWLVLALVPVGVCTSTAIAASAAGGSAFNELAGGGKQTSTAKSPASANTTPRTTRESTASSSNANTGSILLLGMIAAGALLAGIAFMILRDARRVAPIPDGQVTAEGRPARDLAVMMRKRRAKAKAARRQRKRNR